MTALLVIACILLFFLLILCLKLTFVIGYNEEVTLTLRVLFLKLPFLPAKKEKKAGPHSMSEKKAKKLREKLRQKQLKKDEKKQKKAREKAAKKEAEKEASKEKKKMSLPDILDLIALVRKVLAKFIRLFFRHLRIDVARLKIRVAMGDAATTAIAYGVITQAVNVLFPLLEQVKTFSLPRSGDIDVVADFTGDAIEADVEFSFSIRVWHIFHVLFGAIGVAIKHFVKKLFRDAKKKASSDNGHKPPQNSPSHKA